MASFEDLINEFGAMIELVTPYKQIWTAIDRIGPILGAVDNNVLPLMKLRPYDYQMIGGTSFLPVAKTCILADTPGLGKTVQTFLGFASLHERGQVERCLVFCKKALKSQWLSELQRFTPYAGIKIQGSPEKRRELYQEALSGSYNFIFINYEFLQHDRDYVKRLSTKGKDGFNDFDYLRELVKSCQIVVLDEAQKIKNSTSKIHRNVVRLIYGTPRKDLVTPPEYRWALTGTPIENSPSDLYNICKFVNPQIFGPNPVWFTKRYYRGRYHDEVRMEMLDDLKLRVAPFMLRRTQESVERQFPEVRMDYVYLDMDEDQSQIHEFLRDATKKMILGVEQDEIAAGNISIIGNFALLLQVADSLVLFETSESSVAKKLLSKVHSKGPSPKIEWICDFMEERFQNDPEAKTIIFTRSDDMAKHIADHLAFASIYEQGEILLYLGGMSEKQQEELKTRFWGSGKVMISTDAGSEGLNLQCADVEINVDLPYSPSRLAQRIGRIKRDSSGFSHVRVINLISKDSIDERIMEIIYKKQGIIDKVIEGNVTDMKLTRTLLDQLLSIENGP